MNRLQEWSDFCDEFGWEFVGFNADGQPVIRLKSGTHFQMSDEMREDIELAFWDARSEAASDALRDHYERE